MPSIKNKNGILQKAVFSKENKDLIIISMIEDGNTMLKLIDLK